jgi:hypothetical protein
MTGHRCLYRLALAVPSDFSGVAVEYRAVRDSVGDLVHRPSHHLGRRQELLQALAAAELESTQ